MVIQKVIWHQKRWVNDWIYFPENPYSWLIRNPKKSFIVRANSDRERQEWLAHLDRCIRAVSQSNSLKSRLKSNVVFVRLIKINGEIRILSLLIGFQMIKRRPVCIVIRWNFRPTIENMFVNERNSSVGRFVLFFSSALSKLRLHRLWQLFKETFSSGKFKFKTSPCLWRLLHEIEWKQRLE